MFRLLNPGTMLGLACLLLLPACRPDRREFEQPTGPHFSLLTYNVNWGAADPAGVLRAIALADADIVCLQETTPVWERHLRPRLADTYPHIEFRHWPGAGGLAVFCKQPLRHKAFVTRKVGWFPGWVVVAGTPAGDVQVMNVHLRPPLSDRGSASVGAYYSTRKVRLQELRDLFPHLDPDLPSLVAGDFNEKESAPGVSWLIEQGMADALSQFEPGAVTWKWPVAYGAVTLKGRYDHILCSKHLRCVGARVLPVEASDHLPVLAVFQAEAADNRTRRD